jgi:hypothetical protein
MAAPSPQALHTVEIRPPSARAETWNVLRAGALIVLATWIYIADTAGGASPSAAAGAATSAAAGRAAARDLMPYQRLFPSLDGAQQLMFRELREGLLEAENLRSATRRWPPPAALAGRGIPPFADVPASRRHTYRWELRQEGLYVNYLGVPADARAPAFLLLVQEPDPRAPADPAAPPPGAPDDEVHHRLADGTVLHVSIWMRAGGRFGAPAAPGLPVAAPVAAGAAAAPAAAVIMVPYAEGWTQLLAGGGQS